MNKICTSQEQSQKLIELGIDVNTADMYWFNGHIDLTETKYKLFVINRSNKHIDFFNSYAVAVESNEIIPAWSLSDLMELMNRNYYNVSLSCYGAEWTVKFDDSEKYKAFTKDYAIDAAFEMIVWLKENNKL